MSKVVNKKIKYFLLNKRLENIVILYLYDNTTKKVT